MLTSLRIKNFKSWADTGEVRLAPLTVIFGANSTGKSSLGHLLLALKQTALSSDWTQALNLSDSLIDLGRFDDCLHGHDRRKKLEFDLTWLLPKPLSVVVTSHMTVTGQIITAIPDFIRGTKLTLSAQLLSASLTHQPMVNQIHYKLYNNQNDMLDVLFKMISHATEFKLTSRRFNFLRVQGSGSALGNPEKFYRLSEESIAQFQNAGFLRDFALATEAMLRTISHLGPLREPPQRLYPWLGNAPEDVGQRGEFTIAALLAAQAESRSLNSGKNQKTKAFVEFIASWLVNLGVIENFVLKPVAKGRMEYEVLVTTDDQAAEVKITDVGFGVSQVLPALVQAFYCPPNSTVWLEQPEAHLHPRAQAELADVFISAVQAWENGEPRNAQLIIESHSEHFLNRLQRRIAEGKISEDDVAIYFARRAGGRSELEPLRLNRFGDIENWPEDFFGDEMADLTARTVAAAARRQREKSE
jgi:predicted ATPase